MIPQIRRQFLAWCTRLLRVCGLVRGEQVMVRVNGEPFRCDCGCNVLTRVGGCGSEILYRCNGCLAQWLGEPS